MRSIPESCVRGPDVDDNAAIARLIGALPADALQTYEQGLEHVRTVWELARLEQHLATWEAERRFLIGQLRQLERQYPDAVAAAVRARARTESEALAGDATVPDGDAAWNAGGEQCVP